MALDGIIVRSCVVIPSVIFMYIRTRHVVECQLYIQDM